MLLLLLCASDESLRANENFEKRPPPPEEDEFRLCAGWLKACGDWLAMLEPPPSWASRTGEDGSMIVC